MTPRWRCLHTRAPLNEWSHYGDYILLQPIEYWARHAADLKARAAIQADLRQRRLECPACRVSTKKRRRHWSALALAFVIAVLVVWRCANG